MATHPLTTSALPAPTQRKALPEPSSSPLRRVAWENGLSVVLIILFLGTWIGQSVAGMLDFNEDQRSHGQPPVSYLTYLTTGHFVEATAENWESEFLQMGMFVLLTAWLRQKGSAESKDPYKEEEVDKDPRESRHDPDAPWPVRRGGAWLWVYANSLAITFGLLFAISFLLHAAGGAREYSQDQLAHGLPPVTMAEYFATAKFWHESMQNWQSEFLSLAAMVVLTIWLRQKGSPESKPVAAPHSQTAE